MVSNSIIVCIVSVLVSPLGSHWGPASRSWSCESLVSGIRSRVSLSLLQGLMPCSMQLAMKLYLPAGRHHGRSLVYVLIHQSAQSGKALA